MKRFAFLALASLAACSSTPKSEAEVRGAFEKFRRSMVAGDFEGVYNQITDAYRSEWVFRVFESGAKNPMAVKWYSALPPEHVPAFEDWWKENKRNSETSRLVTILPPKILASNWVKALTRDQFELDKPALKKDFESVEITMVGVEDDIATLHVRVGERRMYYEAIKVGGDWKLNYHGVSPQ